MISTANSHRLGSEESEIDPEIAEWVGQEILRERLDPAVWAKALAVSGGKKQDALAAYARIRMGQMSARRQLRRAKSRSFEARRLTTCLGIKTVQDLLQRSNRGGQINLFKPRLSYVWLVILMLGCAGSIASLGRLQGDFLPAEVGKWLPGIALLCGTAAVGSVLLLRTFLPKRWVMLGWNTGLAAACSMACFGSLSLGAKLIARTSPEVIRELTNSTKPVTAPTKAPVNTPAPVLVKPNLPQPAAARATASVLGEED